jgi:hypothetical protein
MRLTYVAAAVGIAIAVPFIAPVALTGPFAHADNGTESYLRCIKSDAPPPPPGEHGKLPFVKFIQANYASAVPPAQIVAKLVDMGVKPNDAVLLVQCVIATQPYEATNSGS